MSDELNKRAAEIAKNDPSIGTVIEFRATTNGSAYKMVKVGLNTWRCMDIEAPDDSPDYAEWDTGSIIIRFIEGSWFVTGVRDPGVEKKTPQEREKVRCLRAMAIERGLTVKLYPDGLISLSNGPLTYQVVPEVELLDGLRRAEEVFDSF